MKIIGRNKLSAFSHKHADCRSWLENWLVDVEHIRWKRPADIKFRYPTVSLLADHIVIFNVKGNHYRLETKVAYETQIVLVRWIGTHAQYTRRLAGGK